MFLSNYKKGLHRYAKPHIWVRLFSLLLLFWVNNKDPSYFVGFAKHPNFVGFAQLRFFFSKNTQESVNWIGASIGHIVCWFSVCLSVVPTKFSIYRPPQYYNLFSILWQFQSPPAGWIPVCVTSLGNLTNLHIISQPLIFHQTWIKLLPWYTMQGYRQVVLGGINYTLYTL